MLVRHALHRFLATTLTLAVVAFLLSWQTAPPASAQEQDQPTQEGGTGRMVMVLDSSGSMAEQASGGQTKIAAAKSALDQVIGSLPEEQAVGLRVYGAEVFSRNDPGACTDSQLVVPVETGNRDQLQDAVGQYEPFGETPIGHALQEAGKDLGNEGKRTIVLVSDGEPTCEPDPCEVARDLSKQGVDLRIDVVGLDVDGSARSKLQCIAAAGNGTYYDADSAEALASSLVKLATRAARPFTAAGQPVSGAATADGAPTITAGDWLDEVSEPGETTSTRYYTISREQSGSTIHASATVQTVNGASEWLDLTLTTPDGESCDAVTGLNQLGGGQLLSAGTSANSVPAFGSDLEPDTACMQADTLVYSVENRLTDPADTPRPLQLRVIEEPPVTDAEALPEAAANPEWNEPTVGDSTETTGGSSFTDAPLLEPGTYSDDLVPGEVLTYQVEVGWGQQLAAVVDFPQAGDELGSALGRSDILSKLQIFSPGRQDVTGTAETGSGFFSQSFMRPESVQLATSTAPVTYRNRGDTGSLAGTGLAGRYTVSVFLEEDPEDGSYIVPFTLSLGVTGDVADGPEYVEATEDPTPSASPEPSDPPADEGSRDDDTEDTAADDSDGASGASLMVGGLGVLALAGAGYLVYRSRSAA